MDVFVYGTLTDPDTVSEVVASYEFVCDARLDGLRRVEGTYPTLAPAPGDSVTGKLLRTADIRSLDAYEGVESGLYVRVGVPFTDHSVAVYVGDPDRLDVAESVAWPGDDSFEARVRRYLAENAVRVHEVA
ncbi:gamma-glutamylcyclotransferase family protein [Haladaptatus sp. CMSO5]|uniref:gamma-glutamylcyclotransferase family protein n=1 Tax=Haladaptatus sp. CMSO5 TaxID=3120514 RepID=UPI002FCE42CA